MPTNVSWKKHELYATGITGRRIEEATNLHVHKFLAGSVGGDKQFVEMIERNGLDMVTFFLQSIIYQFERAEY